MRHCTRENVGRVAPSGAGTKRKGHLWFPFLFELLPFPCFLIWRRFPICDRFENRERQRIFSTVGEHSVLPCRNLYAVPDTVLLHRSATSSRRGMTVPRNSLTRYTARHLRIRRLVQFIFAGAVYDNALTNCATRSSPRGPSLALWAIHLVLRLRRVNHMCSSTVSDTANMLRNIRKKNTLPYSNFGAVAGLRSAPDYEIKGNGS